MSATAPSPAPSRGRCPQRAAVERHFACRLSPAEAQALHAHLPHCATCHRHYERLLVLERLDPRREQHAQRRLATALGLKRRAPPAGTRAAVALAAGVLLVVGAVAARLAPGLPQAPPLAAAVPSALPEGFAARGSGSAAPEVLRAYRIREGRAPALVERELGADDELAFGYLNPDARRWLLVYGVDEHGHVYWFHPSWEDPAQDPPAVRAEPGAGLHELPEAISHALEGEQLTLHGVLSDERLTVRQVERLLRERGPQAPLPLPDARSTALKVRVTR
jgi:hypothetical protein